MKAPENPCRHHWLIETPNGPTSRGVCRTCGSERAYYNSHAKDRGGGWLEAYRDLGRPPGARPRVRS